MHAQTRSSIHFNDTAALIFKWMQYAVANNIDAANIETGHLRSHYNARGKLGMNVISNIGSRSASGKVGIVAQKNARALSWYRFRSPTLGCQMSKHNFVKIDFRQ